MTITLFHDHQVIAQGHPDEVSRAMRALQPVANAADLMAFDDETGRLFDIDLPREAESPRKPGRPSLGVKAKEVTLLPRHWEWLSGQGRGASAVLRSLVERAMKEDGGERKNQDAAFGFLNVIAGDFPEFENAVRAIYAGNQDLYDTYSADWPEAVGSYGRNLAFPK